ncbi:NAD(P)-dependent oxidoreductase [Candidatus Woesearchaeota archaeon]|nr:NAD(P)-dependent oxidoreductase [Candidatus Woesearchaeota archaeon]
MVKKIGFIGLGVMGGGMASNLLRKGFDLTVYNRNIEKTKEFSAKGAKVARSIAELKDCDVVVMIVTDPVAVEDVIFYKGGLADAMKPGSAIIDSSTVTPECSVKCSTALKRKGIYYLDAPVTGSKLGAAEGTLLFMVGGDKDAMEKHLDVFNAMGSKTLHIGDSGKGSYIKLVNNMVSAFLMEALAEGIVFARKAGIPYATVKEVLNSSGFASPWIKFKTETIGRNDFEQHFALSLMHKDTDLMTQTGKKLGVALPGTAIVREMLGIAKAKGYGDLDMSALIKVHEEIAGVKVQDQ